MIFEFLIPKRPVSHQTRNRQNLQRWKTYVGQHATMNCSGQFPSNSMVHLTLIYLCDEDPADVDNIIKPIQDALIGILYDDDVSVIDVESHRRLLTGRFNITTYPKELIQGINSQGECVYVRVTDSKPLERFLL